MKCDGAFNPTGGLMGLTRHNVGSGDAFGEREMSKNQYLFVREAQWMEKQRSGVNAYALVIKSEVKRHDALVGSDSLRDVVAGKKSIGSETPGCGSFRNSVAWMKKIGWQNALG